ncbi:hypothetical protein M3Y99_00958000 [Aphelenchoides fujianensis]|nr:hypothetical protein M3Y99_00958000 [Aphelenchoides fujianensis]
MPPAMQNEENDGRVQPVENKSGKRNEPRQLLRIKRKKAAAGLVKLELRYVSYQPEAPKNDGEVASAALANLFAHFMELRGDGKEITQSEMDPLTQILLLRMENEQLKKQVAYLEGGDRQKGADKKDRRRIKN